MAAASREGSARPPARASMARRLLPPRPGQAAAPLSVEACFDTAEDPMHCPRCPATTCALLALPLAHRRHAIHILAPILPLPHSSSPTLIIL